MKPLEAPTSADIAAARTRLAGAAVRTPLLRVELDGGRGIWLKLENLQPVASFKIRGAVNAIRALPPSALNQGVYTASAGNMAQGVAWGAREMGVQCTVLVPESAPETKIDAIHRLGAATQSLPYARWWQVLVDRSYPAMAGAFIHPVADAMVVAGNATIGAEIAEDLPEVSRVFVPYGGGGLSCGIAAALRHAASNARVTPCEIETAAPLSASIAAGRPVTVERQPSFVDGVGGQSVLAEMWPMASALLGAPAIVSVTEAASGVRWLAERARVVGEGAAGVAVAAGLRWVSSDEYDGRETVCVVSGGNIDSAVLEQILARRL